MKHILGANSRSALTNVRDGDSQPNAIDLRLEKVFLIRPSTFTITEEEKVHRGSVELKPNADGYYVLTPGTYEVVMENIISVGENEAGWVITRSTLNRNGVFLSSGLYDSGYNGIMAAAMHVTTAPMRIKPGTRIGQYLSFDAESLSMYNGSYGLGTEDDTKYNVTPQVNLEGTSVIAAQTGEPVNISAQEEVVTEETTEEPVKRGRGRPRKDQS